MGQPTKDPIAPTSKDPAEGADERPEGGSDEGSLDESHLGAGGDPVEGKPDPED